MATAKKAAPAKSAAPAVKAPAKAAKPVAKKAVAPVVFKAGDRVKWTPRVGDEKRGKVTSSEQRPNGTWVTVTTPGAKKSDAPAVSVVRATQLKKF